MMVRIEDFGRGPRIVVPLGGVDHVLTIAEATELRDELTRALAAATAQEAIAAGRIAPGVTVEWDTPVGPRRATVNRIGLSGRVYVWIPRRPTKADRSPYGEAWFEPEEIGQLRVVAP